MPKRLELTTRTSMRVPGRPIELRRRTLTCLMRSGSSHKQAVTGSTPTLPDPKTNLTGPKTSLTGPASSLTVYRGAPSVETKSAHRFSEDAH